MTSTTSKGDTDGSALQEENYILRTQVAKLQVALRSALNKQGDGGSSNVQRSEEYVSKQQMEVVMGELADLRQKVGQLHEENKRLQVQLQAMRETQTASGSISGGDDVWTAVPTTNAGAEPFTRGDMAFIEQEIMSLKQKIHETRSKLQTVEPAPSARSDDEIDLPQSYEENHGPLHGASMLARKHTAPSRTGPDSAMWRGGGAMGPALDPILNMLPHQAYAPSRPSMILAGSVPPSNRARMPNGQSAKKGQQRGLKAAKENGINHLIISHPVVRTKAQRGRSTAC